MDDKLISALDKVTKLTQQNAEFDIELRKRLNVASANSAFNNDERITQIYEYCIEKIIRSQAEEFYKDFPLKSVTPILIEDFCRMESFRRKDNFGDFCLSLYQQIECMTNKLCENSDFSEVASKMWGCHAYVKDGKDVQIDISNRLNGDYTIAKLIFNNGINKKTGNYYFVEKSQSTLQSQYANDKMKIVTYFLGYKAMMKSGDFDSYNEFISLLSDIYQCRNMNHRGNTQNEWELEVFNRILPLKSFYYFKFMGGLAQYIDYIKEGVPYISELKKFSNGIEKQKVSIPQPKVLGKIEIRDDGKKRFK